MLMTTMLSLRRDLLHNHYRTRWSVCAASWSGVQTLTAAIVKKQEPQESRRQDRLSLTFSAARREKPKQIGNPNLRNDRADSQPLPITLN